MDALAAISLLGNIVQLIDFASKLVLKTREGCKSADGAFVENSDLEAVTFDLLALTDKLQSRPDTPGDSVTNLTTLLASCTIIANELLTALAKLKVQGTKGRWQTFRKALRCVWSKEEIQAIEKRLSLFREEINLHIAVDLRERFDIASLKQSENQAALEAKDQEILELIITGQDLFISKIDSQTDEIHGMHTETRNTILTQHEETRSEITEAIEESRGHEIANHAETRDIITGQDQDTRTAIIEAIQINEQHGSAEHDATRQEIAQLKDAIEELSRQMKQKNNELEEILTEFRNTQSAKKKKKLQERGNAVSAALLAFEVMYRSLMSILKSLQDRAKRVLQSSTYSWKVSPYPRWTASENGSGSQLDLLHGFGRTNPGSTSILPLSNYIPKNTPPYETACQLYYGYFYSDLFKRSWLVDADALHLSWPPVEESSTLDRSSLRHSHGLFFERSSPGIPAIWVMAIITSAMSACSPPADELMSTDLTIYKVLLEVLISKEQRSSGNSRLEDLRADIDFWKLHARTRGIDLEIRRRFRNLCLVPKAKLPWGKIASPHLDLSILVNQWKLFLEWLLKVTVKIRQHYQSPEAIKLGSYMSDFFNPPLELRVCWSILEIAKVLIEMGFQFAMRTEGVNESGEKEFYLVWIDSNQVQ